MLNPIPDLNRLGVFYRVMEAGSASRAATVLHVTPSAISQALKLLEQELRQQLFVRKGGKLLPTNFAHELQAIVAPVMGALGRHSKERTLRGERISGSVRMVAPSLFLERVLIPKMADFILQHPDVRFHTFSSNPEEVPRLLEQDQIDFAILDSAAIFLGERSHLISWGLTEEPEYLVCTKSYYDRALRYGTNYADLVRARWICYDSRGADARSLLRWIFKRSPDQLDPILRVSGVHEMFAAVRAGIGIGILPFSMIQAELKAKKWVLATPQPRGFMNQISVVQLKRKELSLPAREWLRVLSSR